jgi:hypothetical protein
MTTFKPFNEKKSCNTTFLKLEESINQDGAVDLIACDENGKRLAAGYLLTINKNGTIHLTCSVSDKIGFKLDESERIVIEE